MSGSHEDDNVDVRPPLQRRHTMAGSSSRSSTPAPVVWKPVMPMSRRSSLASKDEVTRLRRSISEASPRIGGKIDFALHDVDTSSVQRAKLIRDIDEARYGRFRTFFKNYELEMTREIQARSEFSREQLNTWVNYIVSPKVLRCIRKNKDSTQDLLELLMVSAAIAKYGESELVAKDRNGELELPNKHVDSYDKQPSRGRHTVGGIPSAALGESHVSMEFVVRINERLPQERRVGNVLLREILNHAGTMQIELQSSNQLSEREARLRQIVVRVQSEWFQDAILKANGRYLYDAIRQILGNVMSGSLWDVTKDKEELKRARIRRSNRIHSQSIPPRPETPSRAAGPAESAALAQSSGNSPDKLVNDRPPVAEQEDQEKDEVLIVGTDKTRRKLQPLATVPRVQRPSGLPLHPTKQPTHKAEPATPVTIKTHEQI